MDFSPSVKALPSAYPFVFVPFLRRVGHLPKEPGETRAGSLTLRE